MEEKTKFFKRVNKKEKDNAFEVDGICFVSYEAKEDEKERLMKQIEEYQLIDSYKNKYEDLAYNDKTENEGERIITDDLLASFLQVSYSSD